MRKLYQIAIRAVLGLSVLAMAGHLTAAGDKVPNSSPFFQVIPPRKATKLLIHNEIPVYPPIAKMNYIQGKVKVETYVDYSGEVEEAHVVQGHPFLAVAALKAIKNWIYKPANLRPGPGKFKTFVDVKFSLRVRKLGQIPLEAEKDLSHQIRPPQLKDKLLEQGTPRTVRVKILVGPDGRAIDSTGLDELGEGLEEARRVIANWTFDPAKWGAIAVPWYLEMDVPVGTGASTLSAQRPAETRSSSNSCR